MCAIRVCVSHRHDVRGSMMYAGVTCIASVPFVCVSHRHDVRGCVMHSQCASKEVSQEDVTTVQREKPNASKEVSQEDVFIAIDT